MAIIAKDKLVLILDAGAEWTHARFLRRTSAGGPEVLGAGSARTAGLEKGEFVHLGDMVEAVSEAARKAEKAAGAKARKLYFNLDDAGTERVVLSGVRTLAGDGQITGQDVLLARETALRQACRLDRTVLYRNEKDFLIDDRDRVRDPVGIFGRKLEIFLCVYLGRACFRDAWEQVMCRAGFFDATPVFGAWSAVLGAAPEKDTGRARCYADLGRDYLNLSLVEGGSIADHRIFLTPEGPEGAGLAEAAERVRAFCDERGDLADVCLTGDLAADCLERCRARLPAGSRVRPSLSPEGEGAPEDAALSGLFRAAEETARREAAFCGRRPADGRSWADKARSFVEQYF